jgi:gag-polypeptide of LTR copia-type/Zinc knuckle
VKVSVKTMAASENTNSVKVNVEPLQGKANWSKWKFRVSTVLRMHIGAFDAVECKLEMPVVDLNAHAQTRMAQEKKLHAYNKSVNTAMAVLVNSLGEDVTDKIMRFGTPWEIWTELHKLFDGISEDKIYTLCSEFFDYKPDSTADISGIIASLKTMWNKLQVEIVVADVKYKEIGLPEVLLICKILQTLPPAYFGFTASWMMLKKDERNVDNLQLQLVAYERALNSQGATNGFETAFYVGRTNGRGGNGSSRNGRANTGQASDRKDCFYCGKPGHWVRDCRKYIADGKPATYDKYGAMSAWSTETSINSGSKSELITGDMDKLLIL